MSALGQKKADIRGSRKRCSGNIISLHLRGKEIKQKRKHERDVPTPNEVPEQTYEEAWPSDPGEPRDDLKQQLMHALLKSEQPVQNAPDVRDDQEAAER